MEKVTQLSKRAFWDVSFENLYFQENKAFIIKKAFDPGGSEDMKWCEKFYGREEVEKGLLDARYLRPEVLRLVSVLYEIPENIFRCYNFKAQNLQHSEY
jgi:hypothetical protein